MNINMKKIKNYLILAVIVFGSIISFINQMTNDQDNNQLNLTEEVTTETTTEKTPEVSIDEHSLVDQNDIFQKALKSIEAYEAITKVVLISDLNEHVQKSYQKYKENGWNGLVEGQSTGTKAGGRWGNYDDQLPQKDGENKDISYKEFDVNDKIENQSRDAQRFVVGSDNSVYYTDDHYDSFVKIME